MEEQQTTARDPYPSLDEVIASPMRLKYLSHDARIVVDQCGLEDLDLYGQTQIIEACENMGLKKVISGVMNLKRSGDKIRFLEFLRAEDKRRSRKLTNITMEQSVAEAKKQDKRNMRLVRTNEADACFTLRGIWNLYMIDYDMLASDWSVRLKDLVVFLDWIGMDDVAQMSQEMGRCSMHLIMYKLAGYFAEVQDVVEELSNAKPIERYAKTQVTSGGLEKFQQALNDIKNFPEDKNG